MHKIKTFERYLNYASVWITISFIAIMTLSVFYGVICRYIFRSAPFWTEEIARFMMVWVALIGASVAFRKREHVGLDFIVKLIFPGKSRKWVVIFNDLMTLIFFGFAIYFGFKFAAQGYRIVSPATGMKMFVPYVGIPVGCIFCFLQISVNILRDLFLEPAENA
jgi:TRAP-type C4-dicarboxylate transport system permease small subunit